MSNIDKQALREAAERAESDSWGYDRDEFNEALTPSTVLALLDELEAKEKRIADLEAREVVLPSTQDVHPLGPQSAKIFCEFHRSIVNRCADEIRKVGVKVSIKGN
ncbi:ead/Ea22-like family protein [Salmonella enterica subsp. enterica serovar Minnesota]|nr:ead/Ea22-like family protein [Salmonella enterica subsp. enterica serovar Minnesota]